MYVRIKAPVAAVALAVALALAGCAAPSDDAKPSAAGSASAPAKGGRAVTRDTVDEDLRDAIRKSGLDPAQGMTTAEKGGKKHPNRVDWFATVKTSEAEQALPKIGAELERKGWKPDTTIDSVHRYEKPGWRLLVSSMGSDTMPTLPEGSSMIQLNATNVGDITG